VNDVLHRYISVLLMYISVLPTDIFRFPTVRPASQLHLGASHSSSCFFWRTSAMNDVLHRHISVLPTDIFMLPTKCFTGASRCFPQFVVLLLADVRNE
jgi:hypothetical protein